MRNVKQGLFARGKTRSIGGGQWVAWVCATFALALTSDPVIANSDAARNAGAAWLVKQQLGDGSWSTSTGELAVQATSAALLALRDAGLSKSPTFGAGVAWLSNADADSVDAIARKIEALSLAGHVTGAKTEVARLYAMQSLSDASIWAGYGAINTTDYIDTALGLGALRVGDAAFASVAYGNASGGNLIANSLCNLAANRITIASGKQAWPASSSASGQSAGQGRPSVLATALLIAELRALQRNSALSNVTLGCGSASYTINDLLTPAIAWLTDQQNSDGGFGEQRTNGSKGNSNVLVSATVLKAFSAQAAPPQPQTDNARTWLLNKQSSTNGSWDGDPLVTAMVLQALPAATGVHLTDADKDGLTDSIESSLGSDKSAGSDARSQLNTPTQSVAGTTTSGFSVNAVLGAPFSYSLGGSGSYSLTSGALPPGLSVDASNGQISGTPSQAGGYSFEYQSGEGTVIGRIDVTAPHESGDTPLPAWALLALGASLMGAIRRTHRATTI